MSVRRQMAWALAFILGTLVCALTVGAFMQIGSGLLILFPLATLCWFAREMTWETEFELAMQRLAKYTKPP